MADRQSVGEGNDMEWIAIDGTALAYEVSGSGEPVVFIHGALIADAFPPLLAEPALRERYRLIHYHRRGYGGSAPGATSVDLARQAADCRALLDHLGVPRAHVVGHSLGGTIALRLALDAPERVHSLAVLEPALVLGASAQPYREAIARNQQRYRAGDAAGTVDEFLQVRFGPGYRAAFLDRAVPEAFAQAIADAGTAFERDMPAVGEWAFTQAEAQRISQPVLAVLGSESEALWPRFGETHRLLLRWLPQVEEYVLPGATHALQLQNPRDMAAALADFLARHPLPSPGQ
jgi:pimeloyl-ACP methyl ester carboxylesterase